MNLRIQILYIEAKKIEWNEFNNAITDWEIKKYLERF